MRRVRATIVTRNGRDYFKIDYMRLESTCGTRKNYGWRMLGAIPL